MKSNNFKGKVAFVTGAASGIGRATAISSVILSKARYELAGEEVTSM